VSGRPARNASGRPAWNASGRRIVIIDPAFLGDAVFSGPLVRSLKRAGARAVGLVVRPPADAIAQAMSGLDEVHVFDKYGRDRGPSGLRRIARELERTAYDIALVPHPSARSALLARMARIPVRIGAGRGPRAALFTRRLRPIEPQETFVDFRLRIGGFDTLRPDDRQLSGVLSAPSRTDDVGREVDDAVRETDGGGRKTDDAGRRIGLVLGSNYATKRWSPENAAVFVANLEDAGRLVLLGTEEERPLFDAIEAAPADALDSSEDRLGEDVASLVKTIAGLDLLVSGDTGPLHIARALGVPVVALFGPTPADRHSFGTADQVLSTGIECQPCGPHGHDRCPLGHHRCMTELTGESVASATSRIVRTRPQRTEV